MRCRAQRARVAEATDLEARGRAALETQAWGLPES